MKSLLLVFTLSTVLAFAAPLVAAAEAPSKPATASGAKPAGNASAETEGWVKRLDDAKARLDSAEKSFTELTHAKGRNAARRYPRGDAKAKYLNDLNVAAAEYRAAAVALPQLVEEARRAGVAPGVLDPYEAAAQAAAAVANADDSAIADDEASGSSNSDSNSNGSNDGDANGDTSE